VLQCVAVCCSVLQCVAVCCGVLQRVTTRCFVLQRVATQCVAVIAVTVQSVHLLLCTNPVLLHGSHKMWCEQKCVAACCNVLQCVAVCGGSVLQ